MNQLQYSCLIVEDDPAFVDILKIFIKTMDEIKILTNCDNTLDAARFIDSDKPDILLLDINISGLEGPEVLELSDHKPKTIVISGQPKEIMENYNVEYVNFIQKPLENREQLEASIYKCINQIQSK